MSTAKPVSSVASVTSLAPTTDYLLALQNGALKKILPKRLSFIEVGQKEAAESTMDVVDFFRKYGSTATPGTIIGDQLFSNAVVWKVNLGNVTVNLQNYCCVVMRNVNGLLNQWSYVSLYFIPCHSEQLSTFRVTLSIGSDANSVKRTVARVCTAEVTLSDTVSMGGGITSYPIGCYDLSEGRWRHECDKNSCGDAESNPNGELIFNSFDSLVRFVGEACEESECVPDTVFSGLHGFERSRGWVHEDFTQVSEHSKCCGKRRLGANAKVRLKCQDSDLFFLDYTSRHVLTETPINRQCSHRHVGSVVKGNDNHTSHIADRKGVVAA